MKRTSVKGKKIIFKHSQNQRVYNLETLGGIDKKNATIRDSITKELWKTF